MIINGAEAGWTRAVWPPRPAPPDGRRDAGGGLARWLPLRASEALGRADMTGTAGFLPQWGGGLVLAGYAIAFAAAAMVTTLRRDVT